MELIILGQAYTVEYQKEKDNPKMEGADGICEPFSKLCMHFSARAD